MLGKLSSAASVIEVLRGHQCMNYAVTEFVQGQRTRRWCVAWSWMAFRPSLAVARGGVGAGSAIEKRLLPALTEVDFGADVDDGGDVDGVCRRVDEELGRLDLEWRFQPARRIGMLRSQAGDVWSRKARRRKERLKRAKDKDEDEDEEMRDHDHDDDSDESEENEPGLVAKISVLAAHAKASANPMTTATTRVHIRWLRGQDAVVFESFCGWLKRKLESRA